MLRMPRWSLLVAGTLTSFGLAALPALAQTGADFYKGQTVTYIVATAPGGGYDLYGRMVAEYMQRYLPGSTFVVKNVPGAGHLVGTNTIYAAKPDGLTVGTFNTGLIYNQLIGLDGVKFDLTKMSWIGKASSEPRVIVIAAQSPIKTFAQLREQKEPVNFATAGIGSAAYVETAMLTNLLKLPIKIQTGYSGNDDQLAMRRGEIVGTVSSRSTVEQFMQNGYARFIAQIGGTAKDFPQLRDLVKEKDALSLIQLIEAQGDIQRFTAGPPGIPKDRLDALRTAFRKAMEDAELQAKAIKAGRPLDPAYGDDVLKMITGALNQPPATIAMLKQALEPPKAIPTAAAPAIAAASKGTIAEYDGRSAFTIKGADGKSVKGTISGSRTKVTIKGAAGSREALKVGMACAVTGPADGEATEVVCD